ncbi:hypothetical protein CCC_00362 [Paramagnetospirillum magnetotacticum MS-1]|uniref:Uncharacterized protein n=1 Tax=Paramagnetospirillum magnetotacticum MS-1 TaxID=272627 RepID=A0A0C2UWV2_PARME|nr:hypothetical protein [Paramagnetospirillum magnetotacticum]KIL97301.1 hypothetical protein CCC_00362 [Paramagnetospirillum magnetotacticum MS-1]
MSDQSDALRQELEKAATLVGTARRLLATGTEVDLAALEGRVRYVCGAVLGLERKEGEAFRPGLEALVADLDLLAHALTQRHTPTSLDI